MLELKPTIFTSVPRLYNRIYDRVMGTVRAGNPVARRLFAMAYASKRAAMEQGTSAGGRFGAFLGPTGVLQDQGSAWRYSSIPRSSLVVCLLLKSLPEDLA